MSPIIPTLQPESLEAIWGELTLTYGHAFLSRWDGLPLADVKAHWARELAPLNDRPECITWALANKPPRPPTAPEFLALARARPADPQLYLPDTAAKPAPIPPNLIPHIEKLLTPVEGRLDVRWAQHFVATFAGRTDLRVSQRADLARAQAILQREEYRRLAEARKQHAQQLTDAHTEASQS